MSRAEPRLVRHFDGPYELVGGTPEDRATAAEWYSLFAPNVVFSGTPGEFRSAHSPFKKQPGRPSRYLRWPMNFLAS